jgi:hypothetical protein
MNKIDVVLHPIKAMASHQCTVLKRRIYIHMYIYIYSGSWLGPSRTDLLSSRDPALPGELSDSKIEEK